MTPTEGEDVIKATKSINSFFFFFFFEKVRKLIMKVTIVFYFIVPI